MTAVIELDPWGGETDRSVNQRQQPYRYTTYERDGDGVDQALMRSYHGWWARFNEPDPWEGSYDLSGPQSFNRYSYVQNDPVNFIDPDGLQQKELDQGLAVAREALGYPACRSLFHGYPISPLALLNAYAVNNLIRVSSKYPLWNPQKSSVEEKRFESSNVGAVTTNVGDSYIGSGGVRIAASRITINRNGLYFSGRDATGASLSALRDRGFYNLSLAQIRGAVIIHELLHATGRIPSDFNNPRQSQANSELVRLMCFVLPSLMYNRQIQGSPEKLESQMIKGVGKNSGFAGSRGGYPWWWYSLWEFVAWVQSIRLEKVEVKVIEE